MSKRKIRSRRWCRRQKHYRKTGRLTWVAYGMAILDGWIVFDAGTTVSHADDRQA